MDYWSPTTPQRRTREFNGFPVASGGLEEVLTSSRQLAELQTCHKIRMAKGHRWHFGHQVIRNVEKQETSEPCAVP